MVKTKDLAKSVAAGILIFSITVISYGAGHITGFQSALGINRQVERPTRVKKKCQGCGKEFLGERHWIFCSECYKGRGK